MEASATSLGGGRSGLERSPLSRLPDQVLKFGLAGLAGGVLVLMAAFFVTLISESSSAFSHIGVFSFLFHNNWDTSQLQQGGACALATTARSARGRCSSARW